MCCCNQEVTNKSQLGFIKRRRSSLRWKNKMPKDLRKSKSVRFAPKERVTFRHVTEQELQKTWYQSEDFTCFKEECQKTAHVYSQVQGDITRINPDKICLRGLEQHLTKESIMNRRMTIMNSIRMVLNEQRTQRQSGKEDTFKLGHVSSLVSEYARNRAATMADLDAKLCKLF